MGFGLYTLLISAWKSGKNPSAINDTINKTIPIIQVFFYDFFDDYGSNTLNMIIPTVIIRPMMIFFVASFTFVSLTREQSTPTNITEIKLHDLNIMTIGKLV